MQRRRQTEVIEVAQRRVLARVLSMQDDLWLVRGGSSLGAPINAIVTASLLGRDYSSPTFEGEPTF